MKQKHNTMDTESLRRKGRKAYGRGFIRALVVVAVMLASVPAIAQDVTVLVTKVRPTLPSSLTELIDHPNQTVNIMLQNNTNQQAKVYMKLSLTSDYVYNGQPLELITQEKGNTRPCITLSPGEVRRFNSIMDFSEHFSGRLATTANADFLTLTRIPEGSYSLCFEVYRWMEIVADDGEPMSRECADFTVCYTGSAPELITPIMVVSNNVHAPKPPRVPKKGKDGFVTVETRDPNTVQPSRLINIRWTEVITNCPQTSPIQYTLKIVRVAQGLSPEYAIDHAPVVFSKNCGSNNYCQIDTLRNLEVPFERGATYAMQVEAKQRGANPTLEIANNGKSQVMTFSWGKATYNVNNGNNNNAPRENTAQESSTESSSKDDILASIRQPYLCFPYRDEDTYNAVRAKFSDEANIVPSEDKSVQVKFKGNYNDHIVSTTLKPFDIKWMPMRGETLTQVEYTVNLYDDLGALSDLDSRTPLATKNFKKTASASGYVDNSNDPMSIGDTTWKRFMQQGKKYMVTVATSFSYRYMDYTINETKHYVNGIEADTEYDTVKVTRSASGSFLSTMKFQWGVDSTLLDRVLPPQFTSPVSRSTANWDDTTWLDFETATIEDVWRYDDEDLYFTWKPASNLNVKDQDSALYNLYFYEYIKDKTLKEIIATPAKYHKDSIADVRMVHGIIDSLKVDKKYVARVKVVVPDTSGYVMCNHGWSHPIAFLVKKDTNDYSTAIDTKNACFARDTTGLSKKLIHPKVDSLINNMVKLKMGRFNLVVQKGKKDSKDRYNGEGYVEWLPLDGYGCGIKVKFDTLKINENLQVVSGTARSITQDSNNYLNLNMGNNKWGAGFDMYSDKGVQLLMQKAGELGSTGDEIKKWYNRINEYANPVAQLTHALIDGGGAVSVITTPVKVSDAMLGGDSVENLSVAVNDFFFSPVTAQMNLLAIYASHEDNLYLPFLATNICIEPDKFFSDSVGEVNLFMGMDVDMELSDGKTMSFKRPTSLTDMSDGCHITIDKDGFKEIAVDAELFLGPKNQPGSRLMAVDIKGGNIAKADHPARLFFYTKFKTWDNWVAQMGMDPFMTAEAGDFVFVPTGSGMWLDHSKTETPPQIKFPSDYLADPKQSAKWTGFYLDEFSVVLPADISTSFVELTGDEGTPGPGAGTAPGAGGAGAGGDKTGAPGGAGGSGVPSYGSRISLSASRLFIDDDGITLNVSANNIISFGNDNQFGWYFSLDQIGVKFQKDEFKEGFVNGKMSIPFFKGNMDYALNMGTDSIVFAITPPGAATCAAAGGGGKPGAGGGKSGAAGGAGGAGSSTEKLTIPMFAATVELACNSHFKIIHDYSGKTLVGETDGGTGTTYYSQSNESNTRIDLTLHGTISLDSLKEKFKIPIKLPGVKFQDMYLRNYSTEQITTGRNKGKPETSTAYKFDDYEYSIGTWSFASPQKYIDFGNTDREVPAEEAMAPDAAPAPLPPSVTSGSFGCFSYNVEKFTPFAEKGEGGTMRVGVKVEGEIGFGFSDGNIKGGCGFDFWSDVNTKSYKPESFGGKLNKVSVNSDLGPLHLDGMVEHDSTGELGDYWKGTGHVGLMGVVDAAAGFGFGNKLYTKASSADTAGISTSVDGQTYFSWWYVECALDFGNLSAMVLGPVQITGLGGAFSYNMKQKRDFSNMTPQQIGSDLLNKSLTDELVSSNGNNFTPQRGSWVARAGVSLALTGAEKVMNADGILNLRVVEGHFGGITLQVNAHVMSNVDLPNLEKKQPQKSSASAIDVGTFIDYTNNGTKGWKLNASAMVKAELDLGGFLREGMDNAAQVMQTKKYPLSSDDAGATPMVNNDGSKTTIAVTEVPDTNSSSSDDDKDGGVGVSAKLQIPISFAVESDGSGSPKWFFAIGQPDKAKRVSFKFSFDAKIYSAYLNWDFYFMFGNRFPDGYDGLPDLPSDVDKFFTETGGSRYNKFKASRANFKMPDAGGLAIGGSLSTGMKFSLLLYLDVDIDLGFDLALLDVGSNGCPGYSTIGKNGFYGMGQIYAKLHGEVGFDLNLGFWHGTLKLASADVGAILAAGGPKPTWAYGLLAFKATCLGGLVKINTSVDFSMGNVCVPGNTDPLANVKLFQNVTPAYSNWDDSWKGANRVSPYSVGTIVSNLPWNEDVMLVADEKYGKGTTERCFRFIIDSSYVIQRESFDGGSWRMDGNPTLNFTPDDDQTNVQFFQLPIGGFKGDRHYEIYLRGRAFEYRPSEGIELSQKQIASDAWYELGINRVNGVNANRNHSEVWEYRDPVFIDREETTHKTWRQDTAFFFGTKPQPKDLHDAVVFTWPYNGDPHFPIDEFARETYRRQSRKTVRIYLDQDLDFLHSDKLEAAGVELAAYLLVQGTNVDNADWYECLVDYKSTGINGSKPCIVVMLPANFDQIRNKYGGTNGRQTTQSAKSKYMAVRLMKVNKGKKNDVLEQLKNDTEGYTAELKTREEQTTAKDWTYYQNRAMENRQQRGDTNSVQYRQWQESREAKAAEEMGDTAMNYKRKMLKNGYAIAMASGTPLYTLYFGIDDRYSTYAELLSNPDWNKIFSGPNPNNNENYRVGKSGNDFAVNTAGNEVCAQYLYLMSPYTPNDSAMYMHGTVLPPIVYPSIAWDVADNPSAPYTLYDLFAQRLIAMNNTMKTTDVPQLRPDWDMKPYNKNNYKSTYMPTGTTITLLQGVFKKGFKKVTNNNFDNLNLRPLKKTASNGQVYYERMTAAATSQFPEVGDNNKATGAPTLLEIKVNGKWYRVDSTVMNYNYSQAPDAMVYSDVTLTDNAIPTVIDDVARYRSYYQDLYDYAHYIYTCTHQQRVKQYGTLIQSAYYQKTFASTSRLPFTTTRSLLFTWYMLHWTDMYAAVEKQLNGDKNNYTEALKDTYIEERTEKIKVPKLDNQGKPKRNARTGMVEFTWKVQKTGTKLYSNWMKYVLHQNKMTYRYDDDMLLFTKYTKNGSFNTTLFDGRDKEWFVGYTDGPSDYYKKNNLRVYQGTNTTNDWPGLQVSNWGKAQMPIRFYYVSGKDGYDIMSIISQKVATDGYTGLRANKQIVLPQQGPRSNPNKWGYRYELKNPKALFGNDLGGKISSNVNYYKELNGIWMRSEKTEKHGGDTNWETQSK